MKKLITLATVLALVVSMFTPILSTSVSADDGGHGVTEIDQAIDGVTLDGVINYAEWGEATHTYGADSWWFKHDSEKLYIAISIDAASSLAGTGVSVYANVGTADQRRIALDWTADGTFTWQWAPADPEGKAAAFSDGSKLVYEIAVPLTDLFANVPAVGDTVNLYANAYTASAYYHSSNENQVGVPYELVGAVDNAAEITLDGAIDSEEWGDATHTYWDSDWWYRYDEENLYIAVKVDSASGIANSGLNIYANTDRASFTRKAILAWDENVELIWYNGGWAVVAELAENAVASDNGTELVYEAMIPWTELLGYAPAESDAIYLYTNLYTEGGNYNYHSTNKNQVYAKYELDEAMKLDGIIDEAEWGNPTTDFGNHTWWFKNDAENLYIAAKFDSATTLNLSSFEIYANTNEADLSDAAKSRNAIIYCDENGNIGWYNGGWGTVAGMEGNYAAISDGNEAVYEVKVPWTMILGDVPADGDTVYLYTYAKVDGGYYHCKNINRGDEGFGFEYVLGEEPEIEPDEPEVPALPDLVTLDGVIDEEWGNARTDFGTFAWWFKNDAENLYVAVSIDSGASVNGSDFQIYANTNEADVDDPGKSRKAILVWDENGNLTWYNGGWAAVEGMGGNVATRSSDGKLVYEVKLPWTELLASVPAEGDTVYLYSCVTAGGGYYHSMNVNRLESGYVMEYVLGEEPEVEPELPDLVTLDGIIDEAEWGNPVNNFGNHAWWFKHDAGNLYVAVSIDSGASVIGSSFDIYVNINEADVDDPGKSRKAIISWDENGNLVWYNGSWAVVEGMDGNVAASSDGSKLVYEVKLPWTQLIPMIPADGESVYLYACVADGSAWYHSMNVNRLDPGYVMEYVLSDETGEPAMPEVYGDANNDGKVNPLDLVYIVRYFGGWEGYDDSTVSIMNMDLNDDGQVTVDDAVVLARHIANWVSYDVLPWFDRYAEGIFDPTTDTRKGTAVNIDSDAINYLANSYGVGTDAESFTELCVQWFDQYEDCGVSDILYCVDFSVPSNSRKERHEFYADYLNGNQGNIPDDYIEVCEPYYTVYSEYEIDPYQIWIEQCKEAEIRPWLSFRMNDVHMQNEGYGYDDFVETAIEKGWIVGTSVGFGDWYKWALDYSVSQVREYYLTYIDEMLGKYDVHGIELDFMREIICFKKNTTIYCYYMNNFMKQVDEIVAKHEAIYGHEIKVMARLSRDIDQNRYFGMDACNWAKNGWVDIFVPSSAYGSTDSDMPIEAWKDALSEYENVEVWAGLECHVRKNGEWQNTSTLAGFTSMYLGRGADKMYLFNMFNSTQSTYKACSSLAEAHQVAKRSYVVTSQNMAPNAISVKAYAPLPISLSAGVDSKPLTIFHGRVTESKDTYIYIGISDCNRAAAESAGIKVKYNGVECKYVGEAMSNVVTYNEYQCLLAFRIPQNAMVGSSSGNIIISAGAPMTIGYVEMLNGN